MADAALQVPTRLTPAAGAVSLEEAGAARAAALLDQRLREASPLEVLAAARTQFGDKVAAVSSFGAESAVLLHMIALVDAATPVIFLDTGHMFPETLAYRDTLIDTLGLTRVQTCHPDPAAQAARDAEAGLWADDPDACCSLRKVEPLDRALAPLDAWINGRKRYQAATRARIPVVEWADGKVKFNPLAALGPAEIEGWMRAHALPRHPLSRFGFASIGCMPCTSRVKAGEDARSGRWRGAAKTECGIHMRRLNTGI